MATHLLHRLKRVERSMHDKGPCRLCDGKGKLVCVQKNDGEPNPPVDPAQGCPGCGKYDVLYWVWIDEDAFGNRVPPPPR